MRQWNKKQHNIFQWILNLTENVVVEDDDRICGFLIILDNKYSYKISCGGIYLVEVCVIPKTKPGYHNVQITVPKIQWNGDVYQEG